jgi:hypothetical protein
MAGYILIGCVILLVILLIKQRKSKGTIIYNVYADNEDDDLEPTKEK